MFGLLAVAVLAYIGYKLVSGMAGILLTAEQPAENFGVSYETAEPAVIETLPPEFYDADSYDGAEHVSKGDGVSGGASNPVDKTIEQLIEEAKRAAENP